MNEKTIDFIKKAKKTHGELFSYEESVYISSSFKVKICCRKHGIFEQIPYDHLKGKGCLKCVDEAKKGNLPSFIIKAKIKHQNKYSYKKSVYVDSKTKMIIICKIHGDFEQTPNAHLAGHGCRICAKLKRSLSKKTFIKKSIEKHGNLYDYSKVIYSTVNDKVTITCRKHGDFQQNAANHLNGRGCIKCAKENLFSDTETFIKKAISVHGYKYDYSLVKYISARKKVIISCVHHGKFEQTPNDHLSGKCCVQCYHDSKRSDTETFIQKAKYIHNEKYDYKKTKYVNNKSYVLITCKKHGDFSQMASSHLIGKGCPKCCESKGESQISGFLSKIGIKFEKEVKFKNCLSNRGTLLRFDFYIPTLNLAIEFDGEQHFRSVEYFGGDIEFKKRQENDISKNSYCIEHKINLLRIHYNEDPKKAIDMAIKKIDKNDNIQMYYPAINF